MLVVYSDLKFFVEIEKLCFVILKFGSVIILVDRNNIIILSRLDVFFRGLFNVSSYIFLLSSLFFFVVFSRLVSLGILIRFNFIEVLFVVNKRLGLLSS